MKTINFKLSPNFNRKVLDLIKADQLAKLREVKQLWRFSLVTAASAAIVAVIFMVNTSQEDLSTDLDFSLNVNEFELTIDYWSNN